MDNNAEISEGSAREERSRAPDASNDWTRSTFKTLLNRMNKEAWYVALDLGNEFRATNYLGVGDSIRNARFFCFFGLKALDSEILNKFMLVCLKKYG